MAVKETERKIVFLLVASWVKSDQGLEKWKPWEPVFGYIKKDGALRAGQGYSDVLRVLRGQDTLFSQCIASPWSAAEIFLTKGTLTEIVGESERGRESAID